MEHMRKHDPAHVWSPTDGGTYVVSCGRGQIVTDSSSSLASPSSASGTCHRPAITSRSWSVLSPNIINMVSYSCVHLQVEKAGVTNENMVLMLNALQVRERVAAELDMSDMHRRHPS